MEKYLETSVLCMSVEIRINESITSISCSNFFFSTSDSIFMSVYGLHLLISHEKKKT